MEKRILGITLAILGVIGLVIAAVIFTNGEGSKHIRGILVYGILGAIFFFSGIGLIRRTSDKPT